jgi:hypothetical protein
MDDVGILMPVINADPHLLPTQSVSILMMLSLDGTSETNLSKCAQSSKNAATNPG